jgi:subfamily B ATP-binding cassette protein MsbA
MNAALPVLKTTHVAARLAGRYLAPRWPALGVSLLCAAIFAVLSGLLLAILQPAVNDLIVRPKPGVLATLPLIIVALAVGRGLAQVIQALLITAEVLSPRSSMTLD